MIELRKLRALLLSFVLIATILVILFFFWQEEQYCLGVRILPQEQFTSYAKHETGVANVMLTFWDEPVPLDAQTSTIYIPQNILSGSNKRDMKGELQEANNAYLLYFLEDPLFSDLETAARESHPFKLLVTDGQTFCSAYDVIFTTLPVLRIESKVQNTDFPVSYISIWTPMDPEINEYTVKTSLLQWHVRGYSSQSFPKKNWKLSLKKDSGENRNLSLVGLGEDDDWLLNALYSDDLKVREMLTTTLWNTLTEQSSHRFPMSKGEYVEVIIDDSYYGVYLLQRRVDRKYLNLGEQDILLKAKNTNSPETVYDAYEIIYSQAQTDPYILMRDYLVSDTILSPNLDNFVDCNLLLQLTSALDNMGYKNMFYVLKKEADGYDLYWVPWDTDWSYASNAWGFGAPSDIISTHSRVEYEPLSRIYPALNAITASRWFELRESVFSEENILSALESLETELRNSGVYIRDRKRWGMLHNEENSRYILQNFITERLSFLDSHYAKLSVSS